MYFSEGEMASSTRAAQFMKALTRIVWRVGGSRTSLRPVQCTKVNSGISSTLVLQRSALLSSRQLSHACAPMAVKYFGRASVVIPVALRQPGASSLVPACSVDHSGQTQQGYAPLKEAMPELGFVAEPICNPFRCIMHCKEQHSAKALYPNSRQPRSRDTVW